MILPGVIFYVGCTIFFEQEFMGLCPAHDPQTIFLVSPLARLCRGRCAIYLGSAAGIMSGPPSVQRLILEDKHI